MGTFLIRDREDLRGYKEAQYEDLPRHGWAMCRPAESYVPWALTADGRRVIYCNSREAGSWNGTGGIRPYDTQVSQQRRRLCEAVLGMTALERPELTIEAVGQVSKAIEVYLRDQAFRYDNVKQAVYDQIGHYFYTSTVDRKTGALKTGWGFGRISIKKKEVVGVDGVWRGILNALRKGTVDQKLAIHDAVGRKLLPALHRPGDSKLLTYNKIGPIVRDKWFDKDTQRGRMKAPKPAGPVKIGGIASVGQAGNISMTQIPRERGVDTFQRDPGRDRVPAADDYYDEADLRNLLFGAGISGTTGTLLQAAKTFAGLDGDLLKEYQLAIIGYLVGGGMHSAHESLAVGQRIGIEYTPGIYDPSLPAKFRNSAFYTRWREEFYDIVVLGRLHWRYNPGVIPSHLNRNLDAHRRAVVNAAQ